MKKWIHEKTGVVRYADISEKTAKGHGFIPFPEPELKPAPKEEKPEPKETDLKAEPKEAKPEPAPKKPRGRQRKKVD